ncbi:MAG: outer membrane lipoprotein carrier protein LolA [Planctomycetes bacterium]|nr:outer membrane lipoprotein carrier protein LolA [Planctomycetota bacterium]
MKICQILAFSLMLAIFCSSVIAGEVFCALDELPDKSPPTVLSDEEIDSYLTATFKRHENLKWFSAFMTQTKSGGIFKRPVVQSGELKVELPDHMLLDMSEDGVMIVADGKYFWIYDTDLDEVERYKAERWNTKGQAKAEAKNLDMAALLLGADVKTVEEMREFYNITATFNNGIVNYVLFPLKGEPAERYSKIEISLADDALLPLRTVMTAKPKAGDTQPPAVVEYLLTAFGSNLSGLPPFEKTAFIFPLTEDIEVHDMDPDGGETIVPYETVKKELAEQAAACEENEPDNSVQERE